MPRPDARPRMSEKIYILDEIVVREEQFAQLRDAYAKEYVPAARSRGMHLEKVWRAPPVELAGRMATLHILWSVPDVAAWWGMRLGAARANPDLDVPIEGDVEKTKWWRFVDSIANGRKRSFLVECDMDVGGG
jgi:hypothetical protein